MIRIGLIGAGHLGRIHLKLLREVEDLSLVGFFDSDPEVRKKVSTETGVRAYETQEALFADCEAVDIVTPTTTHFEIASAAMRKGLHVFVEKPVATNPEEAGGLIRIMEETGVVAQVGHVERFNPAFLAVRDRELNPMFIEGHRLAQYNPRGTDVSVVLDLMIHDIDVIHSIVPSAIREISASGVAVISETPDIANARIEFENGCVANLTASRISIKNMRRLRLFQKNSYLAVDFLEKKSEVFQIVDPTEMAAHQGKMSFPLDSGKEQKFLVFDQPAAPAVNSIQLELKEFAASIRDGKAVRVSFHDGYQALRTAYMILDKIEAIQSRIRLPE
jgi:predicted dehydrogenase